jgi:hypothetical protein
MIIRELLASWPSGWPEVGPDLVMAIDDDSGQRLAMIPFSQTIDAA